MVTLDAHDLLTALSQQGLPAAVVAGATVVAATETARLLGNHVDLVALSRRGADSPVLVREGDRSFEVRVIPVGNLVLLLGSDVSERDELRRQRARSDEILRIGAHELRNPLHVIGMICHLLENRAARGETLDRGTVERLRRQMDRLDRLINQLLDLSRVQEGRLSLDVEDTDLALIAREQVALIDPKRAADLRVDLAPEARVRGDAVRLGEVVHQLIENAVRFTEPGTPIFLSLCDEAAGWLLTVEDRGPGIPVEDQAFLFQRHVRIDRLRGPQGLGLGLYIAANVMALHGGTLTHTAVNPTGARFTLSLPKTPSALDQV